MTHSATIDSGMKLHGPNIGERKNRHQRCIRYRYIVIIDYMMGLRGTCSSILIICINIRRNENENELTTENLIYTKSFSSWWLGWYSHCNNKLSNNNSCYNGRWNQFYMYSPNADFPLFFFQINLSFLLWSSKNIP